MANVLVVQSKAMTKKSGTFNLEHGRHQKSITKNAVSSVYIAGKREPVLMFSSHKESNNRGIKKGDRLKTKKLLQ
jgi:hypothetical protein